MPSELFASVDAGTSVIKSMLFDGDGRLLAVESLPNAYRKTADGGVEQNLVDTWRAAKSTLQAVLQKVPDAASRVVALAVTGQGDGTWLLDHNNAPLGDAMLWLDTRAASVVDEYAANGARDAAYQYTGCALNACNQSAQLAWLKRAQPERIAVADCAMHCKDWLYLNLTDARATDLSEGVFTFGNFRTREYCDEVLRAFDLQDCRRLLPPMLDGTAQTHGLTAEAARAIGLPAGLPVALGAVDVVCAALGGGVSGGAAGGSGIGCSIIGTTGMHIKMHCDANSMRLSDVVAGYTMVLPGFAGAGFPHAALRLHSNMSATLNLDWLAKLMQETAALFGAEAKREDALRALNHAAQEADASEIIFLPYMEAGERGPFLNVDARAQFSGLHGEVGIAQLARAVYEGLAFAARHCYEALGGGDDAMPDEVRLVGGGARSSVLRAALADILGARIRVAGCAEPGGLGAAMMAAVAVGKFADMFAAHRAWVEPNLGEVQMPDESARGRYERLFAAYLSAVEAAGPMWSALARVRDENDRGES